MRLTLLLVLINIVFFVYASYQGTIRDYAFSPMSFAEGKYYNVIAAMFMHANLFHIVFNMIVLFFIGMTLEKNVSKVMYLFVYFISGIVANFGVLLLPLIGINQPVVGASAAISGLIGYGAFNLSGKWVLSPLRFIPIPMPFIVAGALYAYVNIVNAIAGSFSLSVAGVSFTIVGLSIPSVGHLIGGFIGALFGLIGKEHKLRKIVIFSLVEKLW